MHHPALFSGNVLRIYPAARSVLRGLVPHLQRLFSLSSDGEDVVCEAVWASLAEGYRLLTGNASSSVQNSQQLPLKNPRGEGYVLASNGLI